VCLAKVPDVLEGSRETRASPPHYVVDERVALGTSLPFTQNARGQFENGRPSNLYVAYYV